MLSIAATLYLAPQRYPRLAHRAVPRLLLPLGRNSFYVFIMHVFVCLAVASVLPARDGLGPVGNTLVQAACVAALHAMVRHRFLFRWSRDEPLAVESASQRTVSCSAAPISPQPRTT